MEFFTPTSSYTNTRNVQHEEMQVALLKAMELFKYI